MDKELFEKYFNDKCSADEVQEVLKWFRDEAPRLSDYRIIEEVWKKFTPETHSVEEMKYDRILERVHHMIELSQTEEQPGEKGKSALQRFRVFGRIITRVAAILFLPLLAFMIYTYTSPNMMVAGGKSKVTDTIEIVAPVGSKTFIRLSDGTGVYLNHGSMLRYPQRFTGENRSVKLSGEAYFEVAHNPRMPFLVETASLVVAALGTEFNVKAYSDITYVETTLINGKVIVGRKKSDSSLQKICVMEPGHSLKFNTEKNTYTYKVADSGKNIAWINGELVFRDDSLAEVTYRLSKWYNVEFEFRDKSVREFTYTATFVDETLPQILDLLKLATPIRYRITPRIKQPDGTFSKQKVIIDHK